MAAAAMYRPPFIAAPSFRARTRGQQPLQRSRRSGDVRQLRIDVDGFELLNLLEQRLCVRAGQLEEISEPAARSSERFTIGDSVVPRDSRTCCKQQQLQML